jgi:hypothetical protein
VGALSHFIEREGIATAQVSLIREHTAAIRPPRALWVPFMLGRPFGAPGQPDFQRRVVLALLALFQRPAGPVLEDFPEDAPPDPAANAENAFACPVSFAPSAVRENDLAAAMHAEIAQLTPWYDLARRRRGRTSFGISGMSVEQAAAHAAAYLNGTAESGGGSALKRACDDLKTYYFEAAAAQPGNLSAHAIDDWFWRQTAAAKVFLAIQQACRSSSDPSLKPLGQNTLVPRAISHTLVESHQE